jgi:hypothetical protein
MPFSGVLGLNGLWRIELFSGSEGAIDLCRAWKWFRGARHDAAEAKDAGG